MHPERAIVTDTASSLTQTEALQQRITLIPINITFDAENFNDFTISPEELYRRMDSNNIPKTAAPSPQDFSDAYQNLYKEGVREILSVHLSGNNSGTFHSAQLGSEDAHDHLPDLNIKVINSRTLSLAQYFIVEKGKELLDTDSSLENIAEQVDKLSTNTKLYFATGPDGIKYLHHSGRVSSVQSFVGSLLQVVPIITLDADGVAKMEGKSRGEKKARIELIDIFKREIDRRGKEPSKIGIIYTRDQDVGEEIKLRLSDSINLSQTKLYGPKEAGSVLAPHGGPRLAYIAGWWQ